MQSGICLHLTLQEMSLDFQDQLLQLQKQLLLNSLNDVIETAQQAHNV